MSAHRMAGTVSVGCCALILTALLALYFVGRAALPQLAAVAAQPAEAALRHVIVISLDTTRPDFLGCYGNSVVRTPNIDALARESILFTNYVTVIPNSLPSHTTLFTGKYPHAHGCPSNGFVVSEANEMLPEILKAAGFRTAGFLAAFVLDRRFGFAQGFDHFDENYDRLFGENGAEANERTAESVTNAVLEYLGTAGIPERLFLFVHYFDPHTPYDPPAPYDRMYDPSAEPPPSLKSARAASRRNPGVPSPAATRLSQRYAGEISYLDEHIGRLLNGLRERGVLDQSLLVVTSDHGENHHEHKPFFNHDGGVYQPTLHSVCLARLPGGRHGGTRVRDLVGSVDVLPTILRFLGITPPLGIDGQAFELNRPDAPRSARSYFAEATEPRGQPVPGAWVNSHKMQCVRDGSWTYIFDQTQRKEELFDLARDPQQRENLLIEPTPEVQQRRAELRAKLEGWWRSARPLPTHFEAAVRDETLERLRALGYVEGSAPPPAEKSGGG